MESNLNSKTTFKIIGIFHELHERGNTIVLITHEEDVTVQAQRAARRGKWPDILLPEGDLA